MKKGSEIAPPYLSGSISIDRPSVAVELNWNRIWFSSIQNVTIQSQFGWPNCD